MPHRILLHSHHPLLKRIHIWELRKYWLLHAFSWKPTKTRNILVRQVSRCTDLSLFYKFLSTFTHSCCYFRQKIIFAMIPFPTKKGKAERVASWSFLHSKSSPFTFKEMLHKGYSLAPVLTLTTLSPLYLYELAEDLSLQKHFRKVFCLRLILFLCSSSFGNKRSNAFLLKEKKLAVLLL